MRLQQLLTKRQYLTSLSDMVIIKDGTCKHLKEVVVWHHWHVMEVMKRNIGTMVRSVMSFPCLHLQLLLHLPSFFKSAGSGSTWGEKSYQLITGHDRHTMHRYKCCSQCRPQWRLHIEATHKYKLSLKVSKWGEEQPPDGDIHDLLHYHLTKLQISTFVAH